MPSALARRTIPFATLMLSLLTLSACAAHRVTTGAAAQPSPALDEVSSVRRIGNDVATAAERAPRAAPDESPRRFSIDPSWFDDVAAVNASLQLTVDDWFVPTAFALMERAASGPFSDLRWTPDNNALTPESSTLRLDPSAVFLAVAAPVAPFQFDLPAPWSTVCAWCDNDPIGDRAVISVLFKPVNEEWRRPADPWTPRYDVGTTPPPAIDAPVTATPEPATLSLAAIGIASLAGFRRLRARRTPSRQ